MGLVWIGGATEGRGVASMLGATSICSTNSSQSAPRCLISWRQLPPLFLSRPLRRFSIRFNQREGTVSASSERNARATHTDLAPMACWKSCAESPIFRSGNSNPAWSRKFRFSQGSGLGGSGHAPSFNPARITKSALWTRASSVPQIKMLECVMFWSLVSLVPKTPCKIEL